MYKIQWESILLSMQKDMSTLHFPMYVEIEKLPPEQKEFVYNYFLNPSLRPSKMTQQQNKLVDKEVYKILTMWPPLL